MFVRLRAIYLKKTCKGALALFPFTFKQEVCGPALGLENSILICLLRLGAGGIGFSLAGGIGSVPPVFSQATNSVAAKQSGKILVVFEWFGGNDGLAQRAAE